MKKIKINYKPGGNAFLNFNGLVVDLRKYAEIHELEENSVILDYIEDLRNYGEEGYTKKVDYTLNDGGPLPAKFREEAVAYLKGIIEKRENKSKKDSEKIITNQAWEGIQEQIDQIEDSNSKINFIDAKIAELTEGINTEGLIKKSIRDFIKKLKAEKQKEEKRVIVDKKTEEQKRANLKVLLEKAMEDIRPKIEDKELSDLEFLEIIKRHLEDGTIKMRTSESNKKIAMEILNEKIEQAFELQEQEYFRQVQKFTRGFTFLSQESLIISASRGTNPRFTNQEFYTRFYDLRQSIINGYSKYSKYSEYSEDGEYMEIEKMLEREDINETDAKILQARKRVIEEEKNKKVEEVSLR